MREKRREGLKPLAGYHLLGVIARSGLPLPPPALRKEAAGGLLADSEVSWSPLSRRQAVGWASRARGLGGPFPHSAAVQTCSPPLSQRAEPIPWQDCRHPWAAPSSPPGQGGFLFPRGSPSTQVAPRQPACA